MVLLAGVIRFTRWRQGIVAAASLSAMVIASSATALPVTGILTQRYRPATGGADDLSIFSGRTLGHLEWTGGLSFTYANAPLSLVRGDAISHAISRQSTLEAYGALGLFDRIELGLGIPFTFQATAAEPFVGLEKPPATVGLGDVQVVPKLRLVGNNGPGFSLALTAPVGLPTGNKDALVGGSLSVRPLAVAEYAFEKGIRLGVNLGARLHSVERLTAMNATQEFLYGVGVEVPIGQLPLSVVSTLSGSQGFSKDFTQSNIEWLAGLRWTPSTKFTATLAGGPGLSSGPGTPDFRIVGAIAGHGSFRTPVEEKVEEPKVVAVVQEAPKVEEPKPEPPKVEEPKVEGKQAKKEEPVRPVRQGWPSDLLDLEAKYANRVCFEYGKEHLDSDGKDALVEIAKLMKKRSSLKQVRIEGTVEVSSGDPLSEKLSKKRVENIRKFLVHKGLSAKRIEAVELLPPDWVASPVPSQNRCIHFTFFNKAALKLKAGKH